MRFIKYLTWLCCLLFAGGTMMAQDSHWAYDAYAFEYDMTTYLTVEYNGNQVSDLSDYEVAAFVGNECRGVSRMIKAENGSSYLYMRIRSNQKQGERIKLKVYQKSKDKEMVCDETITFENRSVIGMPSSPRSVKLIVTTFTVTVDTSGNGTVTGAGTYKEGETVTLTALPAEGWHFVKWSDGTTSSTYTLTISGDKTLTAEFARNYYIVRFVVDGTTISEQSLEYEAKIEMPSVPKKEGYTFSGFGDVDETVPAHDVTYNGSYIANKYKVTFVADGKVVSETEMEYGAPIVAPEAPAKEGHTLVGWGNIDKTVPAHDVTYTAEYKVNSYKLIYEVDGVTYHSEEIAFGAAITPLAAPQKEGKTFSGWSEIPATMPAHDVKVIGSFSSNSYMVKFVVDGKVIYEKSQAYGSKIVAPTVEEKEGYTFSGFGDVDETVPAHDVTYNGSYIANKYKVTFVADGKVVSETEMEYGAPIVAPEAPAKEGHTLVGWGNIDKTVPAHDVTYTAEYKVNSYKLIYEVDGVTYHSEEIAFGAAITPLAAPQKEGKTFSGWSEIPATMPAHDVKVIGSFSSNSYMVKFVVDGKVIYEKSQAYGSKIVAPTVEEKEGYTFSGFGDVDETVPAHDVTYYGSYIANKYKVTFVADGKVISETEMEYGAPIVAPEAPVKEGHTFVGWGNIDETVPAHDVTYTAEYKVNSYKLIYEVDGESYHSEEIAFGTAITPLAAPQKEGKTFSGWSEIPATMPAHDVKVIGSFSSNSYMVKFVVDGKVIYEKSQAYGSKIVAPTVEEKEGYTFSGFGDVDETVPAHDVTYYGSYIANKYKVTFVADGKVISETEMEYGAPIVAPEAPVKEGHTFVGWGNIDKTVPAHDVVYTAEYKVNSYKLIYEVDGESYHCEEIAFGTAITPLAAPQKEGKTFSGWSEIPATMPAHDVKVIGSFSSNSYMVKFVVDGKVIYEKSQAYGSKIVAPTVEEKEGYTFSGFGDVDETVPAHDVTYYGSYIANKYKVTFVADGMVVSETEMEYGAPIVAPEAPAKEGYTFVGWGDIDKTVPAHDVVYTAEYKVNIYKLTYILNGNVFAEDSIAYGSIITPREVPDSDKSYFSGWEGLPDIMPAHDVVVYGTTTNAVNTVYNKNQIVTVYSVNGTVVKRNIDKSSLTKLLPPGLYIVAGKKILIK